ncbi:MAG: 2-isopropylmalate synthase [Betaproteobacteria bacterium]|nr:2-isopropylmalate synthase [Betaproteobacteria bacterium]
MPTTTAIPASLHGALNFQKNIEFWDETLREGAERSSISPTLDDKLEVAQELSRTGIRTIVVGIFPGVEQSLDLLSGLLDLQARGSLHSDMRFIVISHVGVTMGQTIAELYGLERSLANVWILAIHSASDMQIKHLFPVIMKKDPDSRLDAAQWEQMSDQERRRENLAWLADFLPTLSQYRVGGFAVGLLDAFRADKNHLRDAVDVVRHANIRHIRLVDTAGTCIPQQVDTYVGELIREFPEVDFYGHFHDDFGMATANAMLGLGLGLKGVDVSVGGFANRAGHPALAEVVMALHSLYGVELPGFDYGNLCNLSRLVEHLYGLMECPTQSITGVVTHSILSGIRTELLKKAPQIFDIIDPEFVGARLTKSFGVRSGRDGVLRFLKGHESTFGSRMRVDSESADRVFDCLQKAWEERSVATTREMRELIARHHKLLTSMSFTEDEMLELVRKNFLVEEKLEAANAS